MRKYDKKNYQAQKSPWSGTMNIGLRLTKRQKKIALCNIAPDVIPIRIFR